MMKMIPIILYWIYPGLEDCNMKAKKTINLAALPSSWNDCTSQQLEGIARLRFQANINKMMMEEERVNIEYKLRVFLLLSGLKVVKEAELKEDGTYTFLFRRRGLLPLLRRERIGMQNWEVDYFIENSLGFLDTEAERYLAPYTFIKRGRHVFKCPDDLMVDVTYQQYTMAQSYLSDYWDTVRLIGELIETDRRAAVKAQRLELIRIRSLFLSTLFMGWGWQSARNGNEEQIKLRRKVWFFDVDKSEQNAKHFRRGTDMLFMVMLQFFQSCQNFYSNSFPELFKHTEEDGNNSNMLVIEADTMNSLLKYGSFTNYSDIYGSNAVFILGLLKNMAKEAEAVKQMTEKMKT